MNQAPIDSFLQRDNLEKYLLKENHLESSKLHEVHLRFRVAVFEMVSDTILSALQFLIYQIAISRLYIKRTKIVWMDNIRALITSSADRSRVVRHNFDCAMCLICFRIITSNSFCNSQQAGKDFDIIMISIC